MKRKRSSNTHKLNSNFFICLYISTCIIQEIKTIFVINEKINTRKTTNSIREKWEKKSIYSNIPKYISPNEPLPIFRPSRNLFPTRGSIQNPTNE